MKCFSRLFRLLPAVLLACSLVLSGAVFAENAGGLPSPADYDYVVNPEAEPLSREETLRMVQDAADAFYNNKALLEELQSEVAKGRESEKRIVVLYTAGEDREANGPMPGFGFIDVSFPPGLVGIEMGGIDVPAETYRFLLDIFEQYTEADMR